MATGATHDDHDHDDHAGHDHHDHAGEGRRHDHHDDHDHEFRDASMRSLVIALALISGFMVVEVIGGIVSGSLALLADAGHMITDAAAIGLALLALAVSRREATGGSTFGFRRTEVLATMVNAISLWVIAGWILWEAYHRAIIHISHSETEPIQIEWMLVVGGIGLVVNIVAAWVLHSSAQHSMNVEGAMKHVIADMLGSIGVIVSGVIIYFTEWYIVDPILSVAIVLIILASTWRLTIKVYRVLMESVPEHIEVYGMTNEILEVEGITIIHDIHVWALVSGYDMATAHILVDPALTAEELETTRLRVRDIMVNRYGISHATIQLEQSAQSCMEDHHVNNLIVTAGRGGREPCRSF